METLKKHKIIEQRILDKVEYTETCWKWTGGRNSDGYGQCWHNNKQQRVHRVFYEFYKGTISKGLVIDHLCRNRACVNPEHLQAVTVRVNTERGESIVAKYMKATHCIHGHEFSVENTTFSKSKKGGRRCKQCGRDWYKNNYDKEKQKIYNETRKTNRNLKSKLIK